jgi:hypothetical protein
LQTQFGDPGNWVAVLVLVFECGLAPRPSKWVHSRIVLNSGKSALPEPAAGNWRFPVCHYPYMIIFIRFSFP